MASQAEFIFCLRHFSPLGPRSACGGSEATCRSVDPLGASGPDPGLGGRSAAAFSARNGQKRSFFSFLSPMPCCGGRKSLRSEVIFSMPQKAPESRGVSCNRRRLGTKEAYNFVNRGLGEACLLWLPRGRKKGGGRIRKNSKGAIVGLVSAEAWQPGPEPLEGGSWRRVFQSLLSPPPLLLLQPCACC